MSFEYAWRPPCGPRPGHYHLPPPPPPPPSPLPRLSPWQYRWRLLGHVLENDWLGAHGPESQTVRPQFGPRMPLCFCRFGFGPYARPHVPIERGGPHWELRQIADELQSLWTSAEGMDREASPEPQIPETQNVKEEESRNNEEENIAEHQNDEDSENPKSEYDMAEAVQLLEDPENPWATKVEVTMSEEEGTMSDEEGIMSEEEGTMSEEEEEGTQPPTVFESIEQVRAPDDPDDPDAPMVLRIGGEFYNVHPPQDPNPEECKVEEITASRGYWITQFLNA